MRNILVVTLSNLGDVIMTTPVIMALAARFPEARLTVVVGYKACAVLEKSPDIDRVVSYDKRMDRRSKWRFVQALKQDGVYDCIVDLRNSPLPWLLPCRKRSPLWRRFRRINMRERHLEILDMMGLGVADPPPFRFFDPTDERAALVKIHARGISAQRGWIVIAPGAASAKKRWPVADFQAVIRRLVEQTAKPVLLVGADNERPTAEAVAQGMSDHVVSLCGETVLAETAALLSRAALVLANDSAVMHLAFELGVPTVGVFGPTDHDKYGHGGANFRIAREDAAACSCDSASRPYGERDCFHGLGPDKVFQLCVELLQTERGGTGTA